MSAKETKPAAVDASDDLDDLDDILDEFNAPSTKPNETTTTSQSGVVESGLTGHQTAIGEGDEDAEGETDDDINAQFAKELAQGMEALMKGADPSTLSEAERAGLGGEGGLLGAGAEGEGLMNEEEMMRQFEQMMADMGFGGQLGNADAGAPGSGPGANAPATGTASSSSSQGPQPPANFQDAIRNTMSRLRESDQTATSNAGQADEMDFEKLMAAFGNADGGEGGEEGLAKMLENMMGELMSKEVLYEPLKELRDKYPGYLANPPKPISDEERSRYENQHRIVKSVIATFDDPKFEKGTEAEKQALKSQVQTLMNEMQDSGSPPQEIIGDLPPELENMPGMNDENCTVM